MTEGRTWTRDDLPPALLQALDVSLNLKARAPSVLRVTEISGYTDWVLILSGRSDRNVKAIADEILRELASKDLKPLGSDGRSSGEWTLLDFDDFMIHIFYHPVRGYFDLESMWNDAPKVELGLPDDVMDTADLEVLERPTVMPDMAGSGGFGGFSDEFSDYQDSRFGDEGTELEDAGDDEDFQWEDEESPAKESATSEQTDESNDPETKKDRSKEDDDLFDE